jgi:hypothetical protein
MSLTLTVALAATLMQKWPEDPLSRVCPPGRTRWLYSATSMIAFNETPQPSYWDGKVVARFYPGFQARVIDTARYVRHGTYPNGAPQLDTAAMCKLRVMTTGGPVIGWVSAWDVLGQLGWRQRASAPPDAPTKRVERDSVSKSVPKKKGPR